MTKLGSRITLCALLLALQPITGAEARRRDSAGSESPTPIVVKLRAPLAADAEASLAGAGGVAATSASPRLRGFVGRHAIAGLRPLYEARVRARAERGLADRELTAETRKRHSARARRLRGAFKPPELSRTYLVQAAGASRAERAALVARLSRDPDVEFAEEDKLVSLDFTPNDPYYASRGSWGQAYDDLYGLKLIGAGASWDLTAGEGALVAVIDTGVDHLHPDLAANIWANPGEIPGNLLDDDGNGFVDDVRGWDFVGVNGASPVPDADPRDGHGHGTHVAGTIAAAGHNGVGVIGVAWRARVMAVKGLGDNGSGRDTQLASAIAYAADNGADVINASWGGYGSSQAIKDAVDYATSLGVVFVASAGNSAADARGFYPAALDGVITVAASDSADKLASFSNRGPRIDVAAPGVDILSLRGQGTSLGAAVGGGYARLNGTSMAAPHVAGLAALIVARRPELTTEQVRQVLRASASDAGAPGFDEEFGYGRIRAAQALQVETPLEARITSPADASRVSGPTTVSGIAKGTGFVRYELAFGAGSAPSEWTTFAEGFEPVSGGALGSFEAVSVPDGLYTLRLTAFDAAARPYVDRRQIVVDYVRFTSPTPPASPASVAAFKPGGALVLEGSASGPSFSGFRVEWARGINPATGWSDAGVSLEASGAVEVANGRLGTWDTSAITPAGFYTLRLSVDNVGFTSRAFTVVYLEPSLLSSHWPRVIDPGAYVLVSPHAVVGAGGQRGLVITGTTTGSLQKLWRFSADGSSLTSTEQASGSPFQHASADLGGAPGDETVVAASGSLRVMRADGTWYTLPAAWGHSLFGSVPLIAELEGVSGPAILAVASNFGAGTGRLQAWSANGTPLGGAFPVAITEQNYDVGYSGVQRLLVADLDGDGAREIVVAEAPTPDTFALRLLRSDGTPKPWAAPAFTEILKRMAVADLDGDGTREVIVVERHRTESALVVHVLGADGLPKAGWPVTLPSGEAGLAVADLDRDGSNEVIVAGAYQLHVLRHDGQTFSPAWPRSFEGRYFGPPVAADLDGDGRPEIVVATFRNGSSPDPLFPLEAGVQAAGAVPRAALLPEGARQVLAGGVRYYDDYGLVALRSSGTLLRSWQLVGALGHEIVGLPVPLVTDVDGDGSTDIALTALIVPPGQGFVDGSLLTVLTTGAPYSPGANDWPSLRHDAGNSSSLLPDRSAPSVSLTSPANGATLTDTTLVSASAADDVFVRGVQFQVDAVDLGDEDTVAPFELAWDPRPSGNGAHVLTAVARDAAGNRTSSAPVGVTVDIDLTPPQVALTAPAPGTVVSEPVQVEANASDDRGTTRVDFYVDLAQVASDASSPYAFEWDPRGVSDGAHSLRARAYDAAGNQAESAPVEVTVAVLPQVSLTAPAAGASLSGVVTLVADATDNTAVARVDFYAGASLVGTDTSAPWSVAWDTAGFAEGAYALSARASDAAGNTATSGAVPVTVDRPPAVAITSPASGTVVSAELLVTAEASDGSGIARVELLVDGVLAGSDTEAPYAFAWNPAAHSDGGHALVARAYDGTGRVGTSATVVAVVAMAPAVQITAPAAGAILSGSVGVSADATDNSGVVRLELYVDGALSGTDMAAPWSLSLNTLAHPDGGRSLVVRAYDQAGNVGVSAPLAVVFRNGLAVYDAALRAPLCGEVAAVCDSGTLLNGRGTRGPEPNQPNTLLGSCADGTAGGYHVDESNDRLRIATLDGSPMAVGKTVQVQATVWAYSGYSSDKLDLYYARDAANPAWTLVGSFTPSGAGARTISASYTLPYGPLQAVRARFRYGGTPSPCHVGSYDDHDDLVFAVEAPPDSGPPTASIVSPDPGATLSAPTTVSVEAADDLALGRVELYVDAALVGTDPSQPYSFTWNPASVTDGAHTLVARAVDLVGNVGASAPLSVTVAVPPTVSITSPLPGAAVSGVRSVNATASDNSGVARVEFTVDGVLRMSDATPPYDFAWDTTVETVGSHTLVATAYDAIGLSTSSAPVTVSVQRAASGVALYDSLLRAPRCSGAAASCDSVGLLVGRGSRGPEPNAPNTISGSCADGGFGAFHVDESNDRIRVATIDGTLLAPGKTVRIDATVWAYSSFASDKLDLYYAANASAPVWTYLTTLTPTAPGAATLGASYVLPTGALQAVRARFRYGGAASACGAGSYDDHDDLVFEVP